MAMRLGVWLGALMPKVIGTVRWACSLWGMARPAMPCAVPRSWWKEQAYGQTPG
jgi:hypothetical protein